MADKYPNSGYPLSDRELRKMMGKNAHLAEFLKFYATRSWLHHFDDFDGDALNLDKYAVANGGGAGVASFAVLANQEDGFIRATTGTANDATASASLVGPTNFYGDRSIGLEVRFKVSSAAIKAEIGFIDAIPGSSAAGVSDEDTPTAAFSDGAVLAVDSSETFTGLGFYTKGSTASQDITRTSAAGVPNYTSGTTPVAAEWTTVRVEVVGNDAFAWANGKLIASHNTQAAGHVEGGVALMPWIYVRANSATTRTMDVDYIRWWKGRNIAAAQDLA